MGHNVLVALDESENALRAADFVCRHFTPDHRVTLMSVIPDTAALCAMNNPGLTPYFMSQKQAFCQLEDKKKEIVTSAMKQAKARFLSAGFPEGGLTIKVENLKEGVARDILSEAAKGYDAVVLGRRGGSGMKKFFMGSISQKVVHGLTEIPVILVS
ncbi:MAG: universal stress protein [Thermodesulfobacteriota bacterium]